MTGEGVTVPLADSPQGRLRPSSSCAGARTADRRRRPRVAFQFLPGADGALTLRVYPEKADLLNVNFRYEYSPSA